MKGDMNVGRMLTAEERVDAALRAAGSATPEAGLQGRILNRLAAERMAMEDAPSGLDRLLRRMPRFAGAAVAAVFVCVAGSAIVIGSVDHSRGLHHAPMVAPPVPGLPGNGIGAASAVHPAAPVSVPVPASQASRGRSGQAGDHAPGPDHGRARIKRHAHKAAGVAVPAPDGDSPK